MCRIVNSGPYNQYRYLALHGHDEDGGGSVANDDVVQILGKQKRVVDCQLPCACLRRPESLNTLATLAVPNPHCGIAGTGDHLSTMHKPYQCGENC